MKQYIFLFMSIFFFVGCSEQNDEISSEKNNIPEVNKMDLSNLIAVVSKETPNLYKIN